MATPDTAELVSEGAEGGLGVSLDPEAFHSAATENAQPATVEPSKDEPTPDKAKTEDKTPDPAPDPWSVLGGDDDALSWARQKYARPDQLLRAAREQERMLGERAQEIAAYQKEITQIRTQPPPPRHGDEARETLVRGYTAYYEDQGKTPEQAKALAELAAFEKLGAQASPQSSAQGDVDSKFAQMEARLELTTLQVKDPEFNEMNPVFQDLLHRPGYNTLPVRVFYDLFQAERIKRSSGSHSEQPAPVAGVVEPRSRKASTVSVDSFPENHPRVDGNPVSWEHLRLFEGNRELWDDRFGEGKEGMAKAIRHFRKMDSRKKAGGGN